MQPWIGELRQLVEEACRAETNVFGYGIWSHHVVPVMAIGHQLAELRGADLEIVDLATLLHDYAAIRDADLYAEHHRHGADDARRLLAERGYPDERAEAVAQCILAHRGSVPLARPSVEAECLADADAAAHFRNVPSLLHMVYTQRHLGIDEGAAWVRAKLERSWAKLSPPARALMAPDYEAALHTLRPAEAPDL
jgi:uncharacterized protein